MRVFLALVDELGVIVLTLLGLLLLILVFIAGISAGTAYAWAGALLLIGYVWVVSLLMRRIHTAFRDDLNSSLNDLKARQGFDADVLVWAKGCRSFLGFDKSTQLGVMLNYAPKLQRVFRFDEIIGCNWTEVDQRVDLQISLKDGTVDIPIPRSAFYDFKTRMFAITGLND
ncbi:hypothetical protein ACOTJQ_29015 [Achromobacter xylosoxidans]|uniref:hypothetical protein n=1 Tax=Achromobacter ruhlandii TaxID=72557 RepID=UPI003B9B8DF6